MDEIEPKFGEWLRGIYVSESNPHRDGMYVRTIRRTGKLNPGVHYEVTDGNGKFWQYPAQSVERLATPPTVQVQGEASTLAPKVVTEVPSKDEAHAAIATAISDAIKALRVLSTMLRKEKLKQGFMVADEILGSLGYAEKMNAALAANPAADALGAVRELLEVLANRWEVEAARSWGETKEHATLQRCADELRALLSATKRVRLE